MSIINPAYKVIDSLGGMANFNKKMLEESQKGNVYLKRNERNGLTLAAYTKKAQYENVWNDVLLLARGLVFDDKGIKALPYPKFFNLEQEYSTPSEPFVLREKMDGSLIIAYHYNNQWEFTTKGSFDQWQALRAKELFENDPVDLNKEYTYLFEFISPNNRIVVPYQKEELVLLDVIDTQTGELALAESKRLESHFRHPIEYEGSDIYKIRELYAEMDSVDFEGFVARFSSGKLVKIKMEKYVEVHKLAYGGNIEKRLLEDLINGRKEEALKLAASLPDEWHKEIKEKISKFEETFNAIFSETSNVYNSIKDFPSRKEKALAIMKKTPYHYVVFGMLDGRDTTDLIWKGVKEKYNDR